MITRKVLILYMLLVAGLGLAPQSAEALTVSPRLELNGDPGSVLRTDLKIINEERESRTFYLRAENFNSQDETGTPSFIGSRSGLATWIRMPLSITLGPGETLNLPIGIEIPWNADPGGHFAAIFYSSQPPDASEVEDFVSIGSRLGTLLLLRVNGDFFSGADVLEFGTENKQKFFNQLPIQFYYRFQNIGEDHLKPVGDITVTNVLGQTVKILPANTVDGSVLPKSVRRFTSAWTERGGSLKQDAVVSLPQSDPMPFWNSVTYQARNFTFGRYTATIELAFGSDGLKSDSEKFVFYIIPWQLLVVAIPAFVLLLLILRAIVKRYNRYIIRQAQKRLPKNE